MNTNTAHVAIAAVIAFGLGAGIACLLLADGGAAAPSRPVGTEPLVRHNEPAPAAGASTERTSAPPVPPNLAAAHASPERDEGALFSVQLQAFARAELERGWRELRQDDVPADVIERGLQDYERQLLTRAHWFGRSEAERRSTDDKRALLFASDDAVALLQAIQGDEPEAKAFVTSERFANLFARRGGGSGIDGTTLASDTKVPDGAVVSYPAGVFAVHDLASHNDPYPADLTVRGAGMDATLLVWDAQRSRSPVRRLAVEDCTVFVENALTDVRSHPAVLTLSRVRFVGFDCGAGHAVALYLFGGTALAATDCRFEGGYGRKPSGQGNLMSVGRACLARFQRCSFERMTLEYSRAPSTVFVECAMRDMLDAQPTSLTFRNCSYTTMSAEVRDDESYRRRDLNVLFPQWKERLERR